MCLTVKLLLLFCAVVCSTDEFGYRDAAACMVKYFRELYANIQSIREPKEMCIESAAFSSGLFLIRVKYQLETHAPEQVDCVVGEIKNREATDYIPKIDVIHMNAFLTQNGKRLNWKRSEMNSRMN